MTTNQMIQLSKSQSENKKNINKNKHLNLYRKIKST